MPKLKPFALEVANRTAKVVQMREWQAATAYNRHRQAEELLHSALRYAEQGVHVWSARVTVRNGKKEVRYHGSWSHYSTTDPEVIHQNLEPKFHASGAAVVIDTGKSGLVVVDVDSEGAAEAWAELGLETPGVATTPRQDVEGRHYYFRANPDHPVHNSVGKLASGLDVRGVGGNVFAPPSRDDRGPRTWVNGEPDWAALPVLPAEVAESWTKETNERKGKGKERKTGSATYHAEGDREFTEREALDFIEEFALAPLRGATNGTIDDQANDSTKLIGHFVGNLLTPDEAVELFDGAVPQDMDDDHVKKFVARLRDPLFGADDWKAKIVQDYARSSEAGKWTPVDLGDLDQELPPVERVGRGEMLYRGNVHWLAGDPDGGKSVLTYAWAIDFMRRGETVILLDEEAGKRNVRDKLRALGATTELVRDKLVYLQPEGRDLVAEAERLWELADYAKPGLVILDSASPHISVGRNGEASENDAKDVTRFIMGALLPLAERYGSAVVVIDHMTKASEGVGRTARGSGAKLAVTQVGFNLICKKPFDKDVSGEVEIVCTKNRNGDYGRGTTWVADVVTGGGKIELEPHRLTADELAERKTKRSSGSGPVTDTDRIREQLMDNPGGLTSRSICTRLGKDPGKADANIRRLLRDMADVVEDRPSGNGPKTWRIKDGGLF